MVNNMTCWFISTSTSSKKQQYQVFCMNAVCVRIHSMWLKLYLYITTMCNLMTSNSIEWKLSVARLIIYDINSSTFQALDKSLDLQGLNCIPCCCVLVMQLVILMSSKTWSCLCLSSDVSQETYQNLFFVHGSLPNISSYLNSEIFVHLGRQ